MNIEKQKKTDQKSSEKIKGSHWRSNSDRPTDDTVWQNVVEMYTECCSLDVRIHVAIELLIVSLYIIMCLHLQPPDTLLGL